MRLVYDANSLSSSSSPWRRRRPAAAETGIIQRIISKATRAIVRRAPIPLRPKRGLPRTHPCTSAFMNRCWIYIYMPGGFPMSSKPWQLTILTSSLGWCIINCFLGVHRDGVERNIARTVVVRRSTDGSKRGKTPCGLSVCRVSVGERSYKKSIVRCKSLRTKVFPLRVIDRRCRSVSFTSLSENGADT